MCRDWVICDKRRHFRSDLFSIEKFCLHRKVNGFTIIYCLSYPLVCLFFPFCRPQDKTPQISQSSRVLRSADRVRTFSFCSTVAGYAIFRYFALFNYKTLFFLSLLFFVSVKNKKERVKSPAQSSPRSPAQPPRRRRLVRKSQISSPMSLVSPALV